MQHKFIIPLLILLSITAAFAQDIKSSDRTCRLVFPEKPGNSPRFVYLYDGKDNHRLYLSSVNFSDVVKLKTGDTTLIIAPKPITDPENVRPEYPRLTLPGEIRNFYIFLSPDQQNTVLPLKMHLVNIDSGNFKIGHTLWFNFTNHLIAAKLGQTKMSVAAGKTAISKEPLSEKGYYIAKFIFQANSAGEFRRITEQQWWFDANSRYVGFIADRGGRLPRIYFFRDFRP